MKFALNRLDMSGPHAFAESAVRAESLGWSLGLLPCNPLKVSDPYVCLAFAAERTSHLHLGTLLDTPAIRHPSALAGSICTVANLAPGRIHMGLGVGDTAVRFNGLTPTGVEEFESAVGHVRALISGAAVDVGALKPASVTHASDVPVWVAAQGPKNLKMAGRIADGVWIRVGRHPANLAMAWNAVKSGLIEAGREEDDIQIGLIFHTALNKVAGDARLMAKAMAAGYYEYSKFLFDGPGLAWRGADPHALRKSVYPDFHHHWDPVRAGSVVDFLPDDAADAFALYGDWEQIGEQLSAVLSSVPFDVDYVLPHPVLPHGVKDDYMKLCVEQLLPHFHQEQE